MIYIKVNDNLYPASVDGQMVDYQWDNRESKTIRLGLSYAEVEALLPNNTPWSIVMISDVPAIGSDGIPVLNEDGTPVTEERTEDFDNSDFSMSGPITDHRDGTVSIKMGKPTDLENAYEMLIGG